MNKQEIITEQLKFLRSLLADGTLKVTKEFRIDDVNTSLNKIEITLTEPAEVSNKTIEQLLTLALKDQEGNNLSAREEAFFTAGFLEAFKYQKTYATLTNTEATESGLFERVSENIPESTFNKVDEMFNRADAEAMRVRLKSFEEWLQENRWFTYESGKWSYSFEQGTSISKESYEKKYRKTTQELYTEYLTTLKQ